MKVALISAVKGGFSQKKRVQEMYHRSSVFQLTLQYAQRQYDTLFVVGKKKGLIEIEEMIEPEDQSIHEISKKEAIDLTKKVVDQLQERFGEDFKEQIYYLFLPKLFREFLLRELIYYEIPMEEMKGGQQIQWLKWQLALLDNDRDP